MISSAEIHSLEVARRLPRYYWQDSAAPGSFSVGGSGNTMPCSPTSASLLLPNHRLQTVTCFKTSTGSAHARLLPVLQISPVPFPTVIFLWMFGSLEESILSFDQIHPYSANCYWMNLNSVTTFLYLHLDNYPLKVKVKKNPTVMGKYLYALEGLHIHWCNLLENTLVMSVDILKKCT